ncbi:MAG: hypothetical protein ACI4WV_02200, partial [Eubacteriales bacterium]
GKLLERSFPHPSRTFKTVICTVGEWRLGIFWLCIFGRGRTGEVVGLYSRPLSLFYGAEGMEGLPLPRPPRTFKIILFNRWEILISCPAGKGNLEP